MGSPPSAAVGHTNRKRENWNGQQLRELCECHHYVWSILLFHVGPTYRAKLVNLALITLDRCYHLLVCLLLCVVQGNAFKQLQPLAGKTVGHCTVLFGTNCAIRSPPCWLPNEIQSYRFGVCRRHMGRRSVLTLIEQRFGGNFWTNVQGARPGDTGNSSTGLCGMKWRRSLERTTWLWETGL